MLVSYYKYIGGSAFNHPLHSTFELKVILFSNYFKMDNMNRNQRIRVSIAVVRTHMSLIEWELKRDGVGREENAGMHALYVSLFYTYIPRRLQ